MLTMTNKLSNKILSLQARELKTKTMAKRVNRNLLMISNMLNSNKLSIRKKIN